MGRFLDGGLLANNPTLDAMSEIHQYNKALKAEVCNLTAVLYFYFFLGLPLSSQSIANAYGFLNHLFFIRLFIYPFPPFWTLPDSSPSQGRGKETKKLGIVVSLGTGKVFMVLCSHSLSQFVLCWYISFYFVYAHNVGVYISICLIWKNREIDYYYYYAVFQTSTVTLALWDNVTVN